MVLMCRFEHGASQPLGMIHVEIILLLISADRRGVCSKKKTKKENTDTTKQPEQHLVIFGSDVRM